jgi:hypothetical protein
LHTLICRMRKHRRDCSLDGTSVPRPGPVLLRFRDAVREIPLLHVAGEARGSRYP